MTLINNKTTETIVIEEIPIEPKYGINTPQIDANTEIRGLSSGGGEYYSEVTQGNYSSTATISITSGFTSKYIKITAAENGTPGSTSTAIYDVSTGISKGFNTSYYGSPVVVTHSAFNSNNSILQLREYNTSNDIRARIENISSTGFDINLYEVEYTGYVAMIVECYG